MRLCVINSRPKICSDFEFIFKLKILIVLWSTRRINRQENLMSDRNINDLPEGYEPATELKDNYKPLKKDEYMCDEQVEYFRRLLVQWQEELEFESQETINNLQGEVRDIGDEAERASRETENTLELRTRDRYRKLLSKIRKALIRVQEGEYGYCEDTGEEIGLNRLLARPIATMTIDAQERWELRQKLIKEGR